MSQLPSVLTAGRPVKPFVWIEENRSRIEETLTRSGAVLVRDLDLTTSEHFSAALRILSRNLIDYNEETSPRTRIVSHVYTSTDYPASQSIFPHNESSYCEVFPSRLFFFCEVPPDQGGETPIADCRKVLQRLPPEIQSEFVRKKWMYVRNFGDGLGLPWERAYGTTDRGAVEAYCRRSNIAWEWKTENRLRTRQVRAPIVRHPTTQELVWFNHATFFHVTTLASPLKETLLDEYTEDDLPNNTYFGDGSPIPPETLDIIRKAYMDELVAFQWRRGDLLIIDNILVAHSRRPFKGKRRILVGMADPLDRRETVVDL